MENDEQNTTKKISGNAKKGKSNLFKNAENCEKWEKIELILKEDLQNLIKKQNQTRMSRNAKKVSQNLPTIVENFGKFWKMR